MKDSRENNRGRFWGNGNWSNEDRTRRGWQLICTECGRTSKPVTSSRDKPVRPEGITQKFAAQGWYVGHSANDDTCPQCQEHKRDVARDKRQTHEQNMYRVNKLHDHIVNLDRHMTENVAIQDTPEFETEHTELIRAFDSLMETAYLYDILPAKWVSPTPPPAPQPAPTLLELWWSVDSEQRTAFWNALQSEYRAAKARAQSEITPDVTAHGALMDEIRADQTAGIAGAGSSKVAPIEETKPVEAAPAPLAPNQSASARNMLNKLRTAMNGDARKH